MEQVKVLDITPEFSTILSITKLLQKQYNSCFQKDKKKSCAEFGQFYLRGVRGYFQPRPLLAKKSLLKACSLGHGESCQALVQNFEWSAEEEMKLRENSSELIKKQCFLKSNGNSCVNYSDLNIEKWKKKNSRILEQEILVSLEHACETNGELCKKSGEKLSNFNQVCPNVFNVFRYQCLTGKSSGACFIYSQFVQDQLSTNASIPAGDERKDFKQIGCNIDDSAGCLAYVQSLIDVKNYKKAIEVCGKACTYRNSPQAGVCAVAAFLRSNFDRLA